MGSFSARLLKKAHQLTQLTRKGFPWKCEGEHESTFCRGTVSTFKDSFTTHQVFFGCELAVHTDASGYGIGAVLPQMQPPSQSRNDREVAIAYSSNHSSDRKLKWSTTEKEGHAMVTCITVFKLTNFQLIALHTASAPRDAIKTLRRQQPQIEDSRAFYRESRPS